MNKHLKRILCIDDDEDIRSIIKLCLEKVGGYDVALCADSADVLSHISELQPDLILMDVMMPKIDGLLVAAHLKRDRSTQHIPIIFMTAKDNAGDDKSYQAIGACGVVVKPFDPMNLSKQIADIWRKHHG